MNVAVPILLAVATFCVVEAVLFWFQYREEKGAQYVTLTPFEYRRDEFGNLKPTGNVVDFDPRHGHYMKIAEVIITLASASLVFIPTLHVAANPAFAAYSMTLLGFTVTSGITFMALMTYYYEMFLFNQTSFTALRSSLLFSVGFSSLFCFAIAYIVVAIQVAVVYTTHGLIK